MPHIRDRSHQKIALAASGLTGTGALTLARFVLGLALIVALLLATPARAGGAKVQASEQDGYGRLILTFDDPPSIETQMSGGILVVSFSAPVDVKVEPISRDLPNFVSVARRDPDGKGIRLAFSRDVKVNTMAAGEKLFVDLMPQKWVGMPPPLPADVVADLTKRALDAERIKKELARAQTLPPSVMQISAGSNDERMRLTFSFSDKVEVRFKNDGRTGILTVPGTTVFDAASARAALPPEITEFRAETIADTLVVRFAVPEGREMRGLSEDRAFVIDIAPPGKLEPAAAAEPSREVPVPAAAPQQSAAITEVEGTFESEEGDYAEDTVPEPVIEPAEIPRRYVPPATTVEIAVPAVSAPETAKALPSAVAKTETQAKATIDPAAKPETAAPVREAKAAAAEAEPEEPALILSDAERAVHDLAEAAAIHGVQMRTSGPTLQIAFPFEILPAAAAFTRGSTMFVVFDGGTDIDVSRLIDGSKGVISAVRKVPTGAGTALEITLGQPRLGSLASTGNSWILSLGDTILAPTRPVQLMPAFTSEGRTSLQAKIEGIGTVHRVPDTQVGDLLFVVTLTSPTRGTVREREFIEFIALPTAQGLAFEPRADDFLVQVTSSEITLTRKNGLTLSLDATPSPLGQQVQLKPGSPFAAEAWRKARLASIANTNELTRTAAGASPEERTKARVQLARFQLANGNAAETKAILDVAAAESPALADDADVRLMRGTAFVMLRRFDEAVRVLSSGPVADNGEAALWRMIAESGQGNIGLARESFHKGEPVLGAMPPDLQRIFRQTMVDVAIAARDYATAAAQLDALDTLGLHDGWAQREVMRGQIAEGFGQQAVALEAYRRAIESDDAIARAEARLNATNLRYQMHEIQRAEAIADLENLTLIWRGDSTEAVALASLAEMYKADHRWRDAFTAMRTATEYHPKEPSTRAIQDGMTAEFAKLFLGDDGEVAPPTLESVALFYDFKELTPPGRKGDELIRKLADRLVEVDLLTQAADLLSYQVKNRLQGSARAQVAAHAAAIELMDRKPGRALNVLHETRIAGLPDDLVRSRLILEARALSELQRPDIALEMIAAYQGDDINRLRADIQWAANRWQSAAEGLELMLGEIWRKPEPLGEHDRQDVLRTAIAYALAEDSLGLDRLRAKFGPKLAATPDQQTFDIVTAPSDIRGEDFQKVAKAISVSDTLKGFLEDYRARYPESAPPVVRLKDDVPERTADAKPT